MKKKRFKKLSHSWYKCKYHIVFCSKYRYQFLQGEIASYVQRQVYGLCKQKELVEVLELKVMPDHIDLALWLFDEYERLGRKYWGRHPWSRGYCVSTVGLDEERVRKYVRWQDATETNRLDNSSVHLLGAF